MTEQTATHALNEVNTNVDAYEHFKECLRIEVLNRDGKKKFSWFKVFHRVTFGYKKNFYFWWRLANYMYTKPSPRLRKWARRINNKLLLKYGTEISLEAFIGPGMKVNHYVGIVVRAESVIGKNIKLRQNTTIGRKDSADTSGKIFIGDNVDIGAHTCIIGDIVIGDNVTIGAMSFVNKDIPANSVVYSEKPMFVRSK
ncbi:serine acetyltransferase [Pantoea eucrina]|uniref:Serine acetyltransferase n=1 Tax=Pantoea eucrina TaxID=472693 RepID=A0ABU5LJ74_9GAMM|nr:serine acetyltransferase [Pantoea eucrina]MDZ7279984.1 serine acetyltransferase [Pantoea eucrina]